MLFRENQIRIWFDRDRCAALRCGSSRGSNHGGAGSRKERVGKPDLTGTGIQPGWIHPRDRASVLSANETSVSAAPVRRASVRMTVGLRLCKPPRLRPRQTGWASAQSAEDSFTGNRRIRSPETGGFVPRDGEFVLQPEGLRTIRKLEHLCSTVLIARQIAGRRGFHGPRRQAKN